MSNQELHELQTLLRKFRTDKNMKQYYRSEANLLSLHIWELLNPEKVKEIDKHIEQEFAKSN